MKSVLTSFQKSILNGICEEKFITDNFVLGGGTALSEFYLKHRYSEDFDFFTENEVSFENLRIKLETLVKKLGIKSVEYREIQSSKIFFLKSDQKETVKTDFNYFPFPSFGKSTRYKGLKIESLLDITVSKLDAILTRSKARDFVDFYFIQKYKNYPLDSLLNLLKNKYRLSVDPLYLGGCFLKIEKLKDYPKMIKKLETEDVIIFFNRLAKQQRKKIIT